MCVSINRTVLSPLYFEVNKIAHKSVGMNSIEYITLIMITAASKTVIVTKTTNYQDHKTKISRIVVVMMIVITNKVTMHQDLEQAEVTKSTSLRIVITNKKTNINTSPPVPTLFHQLSSGKTTTTM